MAKSLLFISIDIIKEVTIGKKKFALRYERFKKGSQYCIRDKKLHEIYKCTWRPDAEKYLEQYVKLLQAPYNPYQPGDLIYEKRGETKDDFDFFQVITATKTKVGLRKLKVEYSRFLFSDINKIEPIKDGFENDEVIIRKLEIVNKIDYGVELVYNIRAEKGRYEKMKYDFVTYK